ncbi:MAG: GNAT family N-acetyltransferase [Clostridiales bacterium]|nr:GNAT family N-acetyltransferase [Clostridiales bacterium]
MIKKITNDGFDAVYKIMQDSFPQNEIRSYKGQNALLKEQNYSLFIKQENAEIIGFIGVWDLDDFVFVEHFAVSKEHRGKGVGSEILRELKARICAPIVLEVEPPVDEKTRKRIAFYEKNGLFFHDYYYVQPPLEKEREEVELRIMCSKKLDRNGFEKVRNVLYKKIYQRD